jgi:YidC/Oxa1 family membrane protein insertase
MAQTMQQQMVFIMPAMTFFIALKFPSGLALYWVITTIFSIVQQYFISGPGGLVTYLKKLKIIK